MNKAIIMGRLTKDPDIRSTQDGKQVARYTVAVDRTFSKQDQKADFIPCVAWEKKAEFAEKYLRKGTKILVTGRIQTGSYTDRDGKKVYTTEVIVEDNEFAESKGAQDAPQERPSAPVDGDGFMDVSQYSEKDLPFN